MASGSLYDQDSSHMVRTLNEFKSSTRCRIIVRDEGGRQIRLEDIAEVVRGAKDREVIARLDGRESVEVSIYKEGDANTVTVARTVARRLTSLKDSKIIPANVSYAIVANQAEFIEHAIDEVRGNAWLGGLLATAILFLFLKDVRSTLMIGLSIPISIMATFALMYQTDLTLNIMSLGGIALGIGMLVDNSIVVLEAIDRHKRSGLELAEAVYRGTREVSLAVTASTLTTVAVFLPLVFVEGVAGQLFKDQALTITYSLLASLVIALTVLPMLMAVRFRRPEELYVPEPAATNTAPTERPLSRRALLRPLQRTVRWLGRGLRAAFRFAFGATVHVILTDLRGIFRWVGGLAKRAIGPVFAPFDRAFAALQRAYPSGLRLALDHKALVVTATLLLLPTAAGLYATLGTDRFHRSPRANSHSRSSCRKELPRVHELAHPGLQKAGIRQYPTCRPSSPVSAGPTRTSSPARSAKKIPPRYTSR